MKLSELRAIIREEMLKESLLVIKKLSNNYKALKRAIDNPNYPGWPAHNPALTKAALSKVEDKIRQMAKKEEFKQEFEKLLPDFKF